MKLLSFSKKTTAETPTKQYPTAGVSVADHVAPAGIETDFSYIKVGNKFYKTFFVTSYPRFVSTNWLQPLIDFNHELNIAFFVYPTSSSDVLSSLQRKIAEMEATLESDAEAGKVENPTVAASLEDALAVQEALAKGSERFFQLGFYMTIYADSIAHLEQASRQLTTTLGSLLLGSKITTLQMEEGFKTTLPMGEDRIYVTRNMDTTSLASMFPFSSSTLTQNKGILYGLNQLNSSLIVFDRFSLENANEVVLGKSGAGKSYLIKLEILRSYMFGSEVIVIDPENEYQQVVKTLSGEYVLFSETSPTKINPFDLSGLYEEGENELGLKILSLHGLLKIALGSFAPSEDAILDRALVTTYAKKGITHDPVTQKKEPPVMQDLYITLLSMPESEAKDLALRMERFIKGSLAGIFNEQSNFHITNQLTVFSLRDIEEELRPIAMHMILDFVWTRVKRNLKKRLLIVDEAWYMMQYEDSASFLFGIAKRARKYYLGVTTATQDVSDFIATAYGKAVVTNSSIQVLLKQSAASIDELSRIFYLSSGERQMLLTDGIGEGLFFAGQNHVAIKIVAAPFEHEVITSNPEEVLAKRQQSTPSPQDPTNNTPQQ